MTVLQTPDGDENIPFEPQVTIIIPHYNDPAALELCLSSLVTQTYPASRREIVVCDNNSMPPDKLGPLLEGRARLVVEAEKGAGPARNRAVAAARGNLLAFIDCDCIAAPGWLAAGIATLADADIVGGRVEVFSEAPRPTGADVFEQIFAFDQRTYVQEKGFSVTANLFCRKATFDAVGPFVNGLSEDLEWCRRAGRMGYSLAYADSALVKHPTRSDWPALRDKWRRMVREEYLTRRQSGQSRGAWLARQAIIAGSALPHMAKVARSNFSIGERVRAVGVLWRLRLWRAGAGVRVAIEDPSLTSRPADTASRRT